MADIEAETLARHLSERSPNGIAEQVRELISAGTLSGGMRLPTVRDLATEIGVSVGTIAQAWSLLRESNLVETRRRGGTRIVEPGDVGGPSFRSWSGVDLLHCSPDQRLLPSLEEGMVRSLKQRITIVIIEHDMKFLFELADRIAVIHWGQVIAQGTPAQLKENEWARRSNLGALA